MAAHAVFGGIVMGAGGCQAPHGGGGPAGVQKKLPETKLRPPTQQEYDACVQRAAAKRNSAILTAVENSWAEAH